MKLGAIVLDSADADQLATFYAKLLGWQKQRYDEEWVVVKSPAGEGTPLVFQQVPEYEKPQWPAARGRQQQQIHLDMYVDSVADGVQHALACGASLSPVQEDEGWRVMLDPAGHPFCIIPNVAPGQET